MRNHAIVLLLMSLFAVTLCRDLHKRYVNLEGDGTLLDAFVRALEEVNLDSNEKIQEVRQNLIKRWWPAGGRPWAPI